MVKNDEFRALARPELEAAVVAERRRLDQGEARWLGMVAALDAQRRADASVTESTTTWLARMCRLSGGEAAGKVSLARALAEMPLTRAAVAAGELSPSHARALAVAHRAHSEEYAAHEAALLEAVAGLSVRHLRRAVEHWKQAQDYAAALDDANRLYDNRRLYVSETFGGMGRIDGDAHPEGHATIRTALEAADDGATDPTDTRTPAQRRLDALVRVCRHYLDTAATPVTGGERPHVGVLLDLESLEARAGRRCDLDRYGSIHPETARRLACDASLSRIITDGESQPLDVGRRTRVVPAALRRALVARDGGCAVPGCDVPPWHCDAHHIRHWADGGITALINLILLCRRHHRQVHEGQLDIETLLQRGPPLAA